MLTCYNHEAFVAEAVESILAQEGGGFEVVAIDDGSTDRTGEILRGYASRFPELVRYLHQPNQGVQVAMREGARAARGAYLAYCDSDDTYWPRRFRLQAALLDRWPEVALVFSEVSSMAGGKIVEERSMARRKLGPVPRPFTEEVGSWLGAPLSARELGLDADARVYKGRSPDLLVLMPAAWSGAAMFRRDAALEAFATYPPIRLQGDWVLAARVGQKHEIAFLDVPASIHRSHPGQLTQDVESGVRAYLEIVETIWARDPAVSKEVLRRMRGLAHWQVARAAESRGARREAARHDLESVLGNPRQKRAYVDLARSLVATLR